MSQASAKELVEQTDATEAQVSLVSAIGRPVDDPKLVFVETDTEHDDIGDVVTEVLTK